jgi:hypothetical protein
MTTASLLPLPRFVAYDANGNPLAGGFVHTYIPGGTTPKLTWQDAAETVMNANPITLDANGSALIYGGGNYQLTTTDSLGNAVPAYSGLTTDNLSALAAFEAALANEVDPAQGSALVGYVSTYTSQVGQTVEAKLAQILNVADFGVVLDGVTDVTTKFQAAINAAIAAKLPLYVGGGTAVVSTTLTVTDSLTMIGAGKTVTVLSLATNSMVGITVTGTAPCTFQGFEITPAGGVTGTTGIKVIPGSGANTESIFRDLQLIDLATGIDMEAAANWTMDNLDILSCSAVGILVRNTSNPDQGDSAISNCYIQGVVTGSGAGIQQQSSGGLKITNTKIITYQYGYILILDNAVNTSDLLISNCSFEHFGTSAIVLSQATASGTFGQVTITGNQFNLTPEAIGVTNTTPGWLTGLNVSSNFFSIDASGTALSLDGVDTFTVGSNTIHGLGASVAFLTVSVNSSNGQVPLNGFSNIATYATNSSTTTVIQPSIETGSTAASTANAYGSLFSSNGAAVTFATAFLGTPRVVVSGVAGTGAISGLATSISNTGFTLVTIGTTNTQSLTVEWIAAGN